MGIETSTCNMLCLRDNPLGRTIFIKSLDFFVGEAAYTAFDHFDASGNLPIR